jgi:hypothetical protein
MDYKDLEYPTRQEMRNEIARLNSEVQGLEQRLFEALIDPRLDEMTRRAIAAEAIIVVQKHNLKEAEAKVQELIKEAAGSWDAYLSVKAERDRYRELMQEFCDRVDRGEVRSKKTYAKFKEALEK